VSTRSSKPYRPRMLGILDVRTKQLRELLNFVRPRRKSVIGVRLDVFPVIRQMIRNSTKALGLIARPMVAW
jgi:hypothetical protein